jgi:hypothetical protein
MLPILPEVSLAQRTIHRRNSKSGMSLFRDTFYTTSDFSEVAAMDKGIILDRLK